MTWMTDDDLETIRDLYPVTTAERIGDILGRSAGVIRQAAFRMRVASGCGASQAPRFTARQDAVIQAEYARVGTAALSQRLGRSPASIRSRAARLGLATARRPWTHEDDSTLRAMYCGGFPVRDIGIRLRRTGPAVRTRAGVLGLNRAEQ